MIDGIPVVDAVVHPYNLRTDNFRNKYARWITDLVSNGNRDSGPAGYRMSKEAYERDKAEARSAAGTAIETQGKASTSEPGLVRFTAPSIVFEQDGRTLVAGGWQPDLKAAPFPRCAGNIDCAVMIANVLADR